MVCGHAGTPASSKSNILISRTLHRNGRVKTRDLRRRPYVDTDTAVWRRILSAMSAAAEMEANLERAEALVRGLSREQFNWRPEPRRWSIAQCLAHLVVVNRQDVEPLAAAIRTAREKGMLGTPPFRYGSISRWFVRSMEPPVRHRSKAPKSYEPPPEADPETTLAEYLRIGRELQRVIASCDGIDLVRAKTTLAVLPPVLRAMVRMPLGARFELIAAHDRRHLWQAEQVRSHPNFPG
jgi:hypothetical protein